MRYIGEYTVLRLPFRLVHVPYENTRSESRTMLACPASTIPLVLCEDNDANQFDFPQPPTREDSIRIVEQVNWERERE